MPELPTEAQVIARKLQGHRPQWPGTDQPSTIEISLADWRFIPRCWETEPSHRPTIHYIEEQSRLIHERGSTLRNSFDMSSMMRRILIPTRIFSPLVSDELGNDFLAWLEDIVSAPISTSQA